MICTLNAKQICYRCVMLTLAKHWNQISLRKVFLQSFKIGSYKMNESIVYDTFVFFHLFFNTFILQNYNQQSMYLQNQCNSSLSLFKSISSIKKEKTEATNCNIENRMNTRLWLPKFSYNWNWNDLLVI